MKWIAKVLSCLCLTATLTPTALSRAEALPPVKPMVARQQPVLAQPAKKSVPRPGIIPPIRRRLPTPLITSQFTPQQPASLTPMLRWRKILGVVYYLVDVVLPDGTRMGPFKSYVAGVNLKFPAGTKGNVKVTVKGYTLNDAVVTAPGTSTIYVAPGTKTALSPYPLTKFNTGNGTTLLYPVYNWIPVAGAKTYQVEILNTDKVSPLKEASEDQVLEKAISTGFDWYDDESHTAPYTMFWRVRALAEDGKPLGQFCAPQPMTVDPDQDYEVGTLGDSISHGGGDLSYSPSDWEYSYQYYLTFDSINLSESGDTSEATLDRFDKDVLPFSPKYLFILTGSNSIRGWVSGESVISDLQDLKDKCEDNDITPIFITLPPVNPANINRAFGEPTAENWKVELKKVNDWIRSQENHVDLSLYFPEDKELPTKYALDGLHLNFRGKRLMARAINNFWAALQLEKAKSEE